MGSSSFDKHHEDAPSSSPFYNAGDSSITIDKNNNKDEALLEVNPCSADFFSEQEPAPTWEELCEMEAKRRGLLQKVELPIWRILTSWYGTCLRSLALDWMIWIPVIIYIVIRVQARMAGDNVEDDEDAVMYRIAQQLGDSDIDVLGGFLSFLLVLFVNQTNSRFFQMYQLSKKCAGQVQDVAGLACTCPNLPKATAHRLVRYLNAAHIAGYVGLGGPYTKRHFFDHFQQRYALLRPGRELQRIERLDMDGGSAAFKELVTWCQKEVGRAQAAEQLDTIEATELQARILDMRAAMDGIYDYCDQPTHFFYIHFLCLLSAFYLPLFAVDNGFSAGWGSESAWSIEFVMGLIVLLQAIFVVGLRLVGQFMIDPYGMDAEDLSVLTYVSTTIENTMIILNTPEEQLSDVKEQEETALLRQQPGTKGGHAA